MAKRTYSDKNKKRVQRLYVIVSLLIAYVSAVSLWYYNVGVHWKPGFTGTRTLAIVGILYCFTYWFFAKMYSAHRIGLFRLVELAFSQLLAFFLSDFCLLAASFVWFHNFRKLKISYFLFAFVLQMILIVFLIFICNRLFSLFDEPRKICIIYGSADYCTLHEKMTFYKYKYRVMCCKNQEEPFEDLKAAVNACQDVYLYEVCPEVKNALIMYCNKIHRDIHVSPTIEEIVTMGFDVSHAFDTPFLRNRKVPVIWYYPAVKRTFDVVCSATALLVLSPVLFLTAIAIKAYDGGPVFYKQVRMTRGGKQFKIYKFRSMIPDAETKGARLASCNDDRITPVGRFIRKTRIDELPQLLNILKGDMSIVGPRPERPEIAAEYEKNLPEFALRLRVKAGLTGYAQVYGKYNTTPLDKLKLDLIYIAKQSLLMDFEIIFYTIKIIFLPESTEGVAEGQKTAQK